MLNHIDLTPYLNEDIVKKVYLKHDLKITPKLLEIIINYGTLTAFYIKCPMTSTFLRHYRKYIKLDDDKYIESYAFITDLKSYIYNHLLLTDIRDKINNYFKQHQYLCTISPSGKLQHNIDSSIIKEITKYIFKLFRDNFNDIIIKTYNEDNYLYNDNYKQNVCNFFINTINYPSYLSKKYKLPKFDMEVLIKRIIYRNQDYIKSYINEKCKNISDDELIDMPDNINKKYVKIAFKLNEYLKDNLKSILLKLLPSWKKNKSKIYIQDWIDNDGLIDGYVLDILIEYLINNKDKILSVLNINQKFDDEEWDDFVNFYTDRENHFVVKLNQLILLKNQSIRLTRAKDLLTLNDNDKIGIKNSTSIDYDVTDDHVRTNPIIIINDKNTGKDYVFFGPKGYSHGRYITEYLEDDCASKHIIKNDYKMGYGYLLNNIVFVDEQGDGFQFGYTLEDEVNILKNDPRIKKVYTTPGHPHPNPGKPAPITRLARLKASN